MKYMAVSNVIKIHEEEMNLSGGLQGIRDAGLLESAVLSAEQTFGGEPLYGTEHEVAAVYFFHIVKNHPFIDGNKRTGLAVCASFLENNGFTCNGNDDDLYDLTMSIADGSASFDESIHKLKRIFVQ